MAIQDYYERFNIIEKRTMSDGEGGFDIIYAEGAAFMAGINTDSSTEMKIAEQQGLKTIYTINIDKDIPINYADLIMRQKDKSYFRITSNPSDMETPKRANIKFKMMNAEKVELVDE